MPKHKRPRDPVADYVEWTDHRYDPGYYLGGNLPPHLRKESLGPRARRKAGLLLGIMAVASVVAAAGSMGFASHWEMLASVGLVGLIGLAAVKMYRAGVRHGLSDKSR